MPNTPRQGQSQSSGFWTRISARIVLMLGFAYAASWWADQRFYAYFGIAPQDVGLTPTGGLSDIVGAIVRLGLWVAIALLALGVLPVLSVAAAGYAIEAKPEQGRGRRVVMSVFAIAAGGLAIAIYGWLTGWVYAAIAGFLIVVCVFAWWFFSPTRPRWRWRNILDHLPSRTTPTRRTQVAEVAAKPSWPETLTAFAATRTSWALRVLDLFSVVAVVGLLLIDLPDDAARAGACVINQPDLAVKGMGAPVDFVHLILLDVYAQPATIAWTGATPPPSLDQNPFTGVYLGTSNGTAVVYRPTSPSKLLRLPAGDVTVTLNPMTKTCKEAH